MELGRDHGKLIFYNYGGPWNYTRDCTNPTIISCPYYEQFNHEMIECSTLIVQISEKRAVQPTLTQNVQMMRFEPREEDPKVNTMLKSGMAIGKDKEKLTKEGLGVHKTLTKKPKFNLESVKKTFMEAKKSFAEVSTSCGKDQPKPKIDPSMLNTFLETCMKLLCDNNVVKGLQELITRCVGSSEPRVVRKMGKHSLHIG